MSQTNHPSGAPWRNFYGRRHGKKLRPLQEIHMAEVLGAYAPRNVTWEENPDRAPINLLDLFPDRDDIWLEVGFGAGEHMVHMAQTYPQVGIIGCEPFENGVAAACSKIVRAEVENIRVHPGDARDLMEVLPEASISRAFLLYPDPWPKSRHHRRRFVNPEGIDPLARVLKPGAIFRVATDIEGYVRHTLEALTAHPAFEWLAEGPEDWRNPWEDWHRTRYEAKAVREGRTPYYLTFRRV